MSQSWIINLPSAKDDTNPFLVLVKPKTSESLDLDLLATDGDVAFKSKVRQRSLAKYKSKQYDGSDDDFGNILTYYLNPDAQASVDDAQRQRLNISCEISGKDPKSTLTITIRNQIEQVIQRIGAIEIPQTSDTDDVDLFGWTCQTTDQRDILKREKASLREDNERLKGTIERLEKELSDLLQVKQDHEAQLLAKFTVLLNEKKLKIRNLQRVLATADIDPKKLTKLQNSIKQERNGDKSGTGKNKRPADKMLVDNQSGDGDESEGFEAMDVDKPPRSESDKRGRATNREKTPSMSSSRQTTPRTASPDEAEDSDAGDQPTRSQPPRAAKQSSPLPPKRELPFQKKGKAAERTSPEEKHKSAIAVSVDDDDDETASEDSEL